MAFLRRVSFFAGIKTNATWRPGNYSNIPHGGEVTFQQRTHMSCLQHIAWNCFPGLNISWRQNRSSSLPTVPRCMSLLLWLWLIWRAGSLIKILETAKSFFMGRFGNNIGVCFTVHDGGKISSHRERAVPAHLQKQGSLWFRECLWLTSWHKYTILQVYPSLYRPFCETHPKSQHMASY